MAEEPGAPPPEMKEPETPPVEPGPSLNGASSLLRVFLRSSTTVPALFRVQSVFSPCGKKP